MSLSFSRTDGSLDSRAAKELLKMIAAHLDDPNTFTPKPNVCT
jgi:hypothetical protein